MSPKFLAGVILPGVLCTLLVGRTAGAAAMPLVLPGDEVRLPRGVDQRKRRFEVTSFHASAFPVEIIDRVPVPRDDDIRVEVLDGATPPTIKDLDGLQGVYLWRLTGAPRKTEIIKHYYSVRFPKDRELSTSQSE